MDVIREMQAQSPTPGVILITHDLGVVAQMADRVMVMYGGRTVEYGPVDEVYYNPHQPYTWGLLGSLPRLDEVEKQRLDADQGTAAEPAAAARRVSVRRARCPYERPVLSRDLSRARDRRARPRRALLDARSTNAELSARACRTSPRGVA